MQKKIRVYYLQNKNNEPIAFFPDSKRIFKVNQLAIDFINDIAANKDSATIMKKHALSKERYDKLYTLFCSDIELQQDNLRNIAKYRNDSVLNRLVIHITNDCNLRCKYCYAHGGSYLSQACIMNKNMLDTIINVFYARFAQIPIIQFFGGEPLLNIPLIQYACERIRRIDKERHYTTTFGLVTNGTIMNDIFIKLVKTYNIKVTVSYDGNPHINDLLRVNIKGYGVTNIILANIKKLKEATGEPNTIEVTYTQKHIDNNVKIIDIIKHIQKEIHGTYIHLTPVGGNELDDYVIKNLDVFADSIDDIFHEAIQRKSKNSSIPSYSLADRIFNALKDKNQKNSYICDAGFGTISVSVNGIVYPCFMFTDQKDLALGNITDDDLFTNKRFIDLTQKLNTFANKDKNEVCRNCMISTICNGCLGLNAYQSGDIFTLSDKTCTMFKKMVERAIINFTDYVLPNKISIES